MSLSFFLFCMSKIKFIFHNSVYSYLIRLSALIFKLFYNISFLDIFTLSFLFASLSFFFLFSSFFSFHNSLKNIFFISSVVQLLILLFFLFSPFFFFLQFYFYAFSFSPTAFSLEFIVSLLFFSFLPAFFNLFL